MAQSPVLGRDIQHVLNQSGRLSASARSVRIKFKEVEVHQRFVQDGRMSARAYD
jgi:hypothetical protein